MALSNWLTRNEWNMAYFAGVQTHPHPNGLGEILIAGMVAMHKAGWIFQGIDIDDNGNYQKLTQCCDDNANVLAEMITDTFDWVGRAREAIAYADFYFPALDLSEIKEAVRIWDEIKEL